MFNSHRILTFCMMVLVLFSFVACENTETLRRGVSLDASGSYKDAIDQFKSFLSTYPESKKRPQVEEAIAESYFKWAESEKHLKRWESGIELLQTVLDDYHETRVVDQVETTLPEYLLEWSNLLANDGNFLEALTTLTRLIRHFPASGFAERGRELRSQIGVIAFSSNENIYVMNADGTRLRKIAEKAISPAVSPDGTRIAYIELSQSGQRQGYLSVANIDGRKAQRLTDKPTALDPVFSPDGTLIWFSRTDSFQSVTLAGAPMHAHFGIHDFDTIGSFNPSGTDLVTYLKRPKGNTSRLCTTSTFEEYLELFTTTNDPIRGAVWSKDNQRIVFVTPKGIQSISPQGGPITDLLISAENDNIDIRDVDVSPNGANILFVGKKAGEDHYKLYYMTLAREIAEFPFLETEDHQKPYPDGDSISWGYGFLRY